MIPRQRAMRSFSIMLSAASLLIAAAPLHVTAQTAVRGGNARMYIGTYTNAIYVVDEATESVVDRIPVRSGMPRSIFMTQDKRRFYVTDISYEKVDVIDIASKRTLDSFTLSSGNERVRIRSLVVEPQERYALIVAVSYKKLADRFEIGPSRIIQYDLRGHRVMRDVPWPDDRERESIRLLFSPDGRSLYMFTDDILVYETEGFTEVDRWDYSDALDEGLGTFDFGFPESAYDEPGFYTGLVRITDPVAARRLMGVARVNLAEREVDFFALGPNESVSFVLAPDRRKAYGLHSEVGNYWFWTFDLANHHVERKAEFRGRPRMTLGVSSNGELLYVYNAGNTIDLYDADTYGYLRTIELDADTTTGLIIVPAGSAASGAP